MDEEARGILRQIADKLDKLAEALARIEQRQINMMVGDEPQQEQTQ